MSERFQRLGYAVATTRDGRVIARKGESSVHFTCRESACLWLLARGV